VPATDSGPAPTPLAVGPRPVGDPDGMRALAARLRHEAARLAKHESLDLHAWRSDRAKQVRHQLDDFATTMGRESNLLDGLADELVTAATNVQSQQIDWSARKALADAKNSTIPVSKI
jgi:hypothetical protein